MKNLIFTILILFSPLSAPIFANGFDSVYTSIKEKDCKLIQLNKETGSSTSRCMGFRNFEVNILTDDLRQKSIFILHDNREYPLNLWTEDFSEMGSLIEWRYKRGKQEKLAGIIARLNIYNYPEKPGKKTSYLLVFKVVPGQICVVGKIQPQENQNVLARHMAEKSVKLHCIQ